MSALTDLTKQAGTLPPARQVELPSAAELELEPAMLPRDAFFAPKETVPASQAAGRICAEQITPYPPGIPVIIPGERITAELLDYLRSGVSAGHATPRRRRSHPRQDQGRQAALTGISGTRTDQMLWSCGRAAPRHLRTALGQRI